MLYRLFALIIFIHSQSLSWMYGFGFDGSDKSNVSDKSNDAFIQSSCGSDNSFILDILKI